MDRGIKRYFIFRRKIVPSVKTNGVTCDGGRVRAKTGETDQTERLEKRVFMEAIHSTRNESKDEK